MLFDLRRSLDGCLRAWLPAGVDVVFCAPLPQWHEHPPSQPTLSVFRFELREELSMSAAERVLVRDVDGRAVGWQLPTKRYLAWFLLTAHGNSGAAATAEEAILDAVLTGCAEFSAIPSAHLHGTLAEGSSVQLTCAPAESPATSTELWSSLQLAAQPSLTLLATVPLVLPLQTDLAPGVDGISLGVRAEPRRSSDPTPHAEDNESGEKSARRWAKAVIRE